MNRRDCAVFYAFQGAKEASDQTGRLIAVSASLTYLQLLMNMAIATVTGMVDNARAVPNRPVF